MVIYDRGNIVWVWLLLIWNDLMGKKKEVLHGDFAIGERFKGKLVVGGVLPEDKGKDDVVDGPL